MYTKLFKIEKNSFEHKLLKIFILLVTIIFAVLIVFSSIRIAKTKGKIAETLMENISSRVSTETERFLDPVIKGLTLAKDLGEVSEIVNTIKSLNQLFAPMLNRNSYIYSVMIAGKDGSEYEFKKLNDGWESVAVERKGAVRKITEWSNDMNEVKSEMVKTAFGYDKTDWYLGALKSNENVIYWTNFYTNPSDQKEVITASIKLTDEKTKDSFVVAYNVLQSDFAKFVESIDVSETGRAFLLNAKREVVDLNLMEDSANLNQALIDGVKNWEKGGIEDDAPKSFKGNKGLWWSVMRPLVLGDKILWLATIVPDVDFEDDIEKKRYVNFGIIIGSFIGCVLLAGILVKYYGGSLRRLAIQNKPTHGSSDEIMSLIRLGESDKLEFKSTMRMNLKTEKKDKNIELAWLKNVVAFMNTSGGTIMLGIADNGEIIGIEQDDFANDDKCLLHFNNLIKQHVGLEYAQYINFEIKEVNGKKIVIVDLEKSKSPVFLKNGDEEDFYVRSGPSSTKLPTSKAMEYIKNNI